MGEVSALALNSDGSLVVSDYANGAIYTIQCQLSPALSTKVYQMRAARAFQRNMFHILICLRELIIKRRAGLRCIATVTVFEDGSRTEPAFRFSDLQSILMSLCKLPKNIIQLVVTHLS